MATDRILVTFAIIGETAEAYADVHEDLIYEDFVGRFNNTDIESVGVIKKAHRESGPRGKAWKQ